MSDWIATLEVGSGGVGTFFVPTHRMDLMLWDRAGLMLYTGTGEEPMATWLPARPENHLRDALAMLRLHVGGVAPEMVPPALRKAKVTLDETHDKYLDALANSFHEGWNRALRIDEDQPGELGVEAELTGRLRGLEVRMVRTVQRGPNPWASRG